MGLVKDGTLRYSRDLTGEEGLVETIPAALAKMRLDFIKDDGALDTVFCGTGMDDPLLECLDNTGGIALQPVDLSASQIPSTALMVAFGLALKGVRKTSMDINLMPPALRKKPSKFKYYTLFGLVSMALLGALAWGGGVFFSAAVDAG